MGHFYLVTLILTTRSILLETNCFPLNPTYLFVWVQTLLLKTEALNLVEILPSLVGNNVVRGNAVNGLVSGVPCRVKCKHCFPRSHPDIRLSGLEIPAHAGCSVGRKVDADQAVSHFLHLLDLLRRLVCKRSATSARRLTK
uniref:Putative secreted protein n=1 Tax=Ixodes ricinus TaxID=34613 RepID=A0A6B0UTK0_IXORI